MPSMDGADEQSLYRRQSTKRSYSTMASSHREPTDEGSSSLFIPEDDHYHNEHAARRPRLALPPMRDRPPRYAGDGLDYRRPVMSGVTSAAAPPAASAPVIDLTDDTLVDTDEDEGTSSTSARATVGSRASAASRLPRFGGGRDIINLEDRPDRGAREGIERRLAFTARDGFGASQAGLAARPQYSQLRRPARYDRAPTPATRSMGTGDDELEIVSERPLSRPQTISRQQTPAMYAGPRSLTPFPADLDDMIDLTADDDVVHVDTRPRAGGINAARPGLTGGVGTRSENEEGPGMGIGRSIMDRINRIRSLGGDPNGRLAAAVQRQQNAAYRQMQEMRRLVDAQRRDNGMYGHAGLPGMHGMPGLMDYGGAAFDLGYEGHEPRRAPSPKYEAPPAAEKGFTRNPTEDEVVVCPNCGDELAVSEDDIKQQVWVIKTCGHAYCGECAQNRLRKPSKKGKGKATDFMHLPPTFNKCVVDGCEKSASRSQMIQVYLGS